MDNVSAEFEMDPQHGPIIRVRINGISVGVYLAQETAIATYPSGAQAGIEAKGPWWKFRQYVETPTLTLPDEVVDVKRLLECQKRCSELEIENKNLRDEWCEQFAKRGSEVASVERQKARLVKALYNIIDACDGDDDSMGSDPAEIARAALAAGGE